MGLLGRNISDARESVIGPARQHHGFIVEEQFQPLSARREPSYVGYFAEVGDALRLQIGLHHLAASGFVESSQDSRISYRLEPGDLLAAGQAYFLARIGPIYYRRCLCTAVFFREGESPVPEVCPGAQPDCSPVCQQFVTPERA